MERGVGQGKCEVEAVLEGVADDVGMVSCMVGSNGFGR